MSDKGKETRLKIILLRDELVAEDGQSGGPRKLPTVLELALERLPCLDNEKRGRVGPCEKFSMLGIVLKTEGKSHSESMPPQNRVATQGISVG